MNRNWSNSFFPQESFQGHLSYIENNQKLNTKTYLNPQNVNYEFIRNSLSKGCLQGKNKIHVNPNFRGKNLDNTTIKSYPNLIKKLNSQNVSCSEPGTSDTPSVREEKSCVNSSELVKDKNSESSTVIPYQSRFKKVNAISSKSSSKSPYSWCKNKSKEIGMNLYFKNQSGASTFKSVVKEAMNYNHNQNAYVCTPLAHPVDQICENTKKRVIFQSKNKIINECKTRLLSSTSPRAKLNLKEKKLNVSFKGHLNLSKFTNGNSQKSSVLMVARAVRSKYKYLSNSEQYKKSKYKIDKRNRIPEIIKKKSSAREIRDIRKFFPNSLYNKMKISSYNVYNLNKCQTVTKSKHLLRKNQSLDKVHKKINQFQNKRVVKIGGILYKSTSTKLTLASQKPEISSKKLKSKVKKSCVVYVRGEKFTLENNGKALKRQPINPVNDKTPLLTPRRIDIGGVTYLRKSRNVLIRTNVHQARQFVKKAKNKSIALLAKLHKRSSMPCMIYHRFGMCNRHNKGLCMYKHDPKNISVCKKFLKGDCSEKKCLLSHQIIQEKMATCHFFLKGLCVKENCPFLHVKLSKNAAICENFLQGFCNLGKECSKKHLHLCPEFDKYGTCNLGLKCHYPHKKHKNEEILEQKGAENICENQSKPKDNSETSQNCLPTERQKKRKKIKQGTVNVSTKSQKLATKKGLSVNTFERSGDVIECFPKRIKLDKLPCFIPLSSGS